MYKDEVETNNYQAGEGRVDRKDNRPQACA